MVWWYEYGGGDHRLLYAVDALRRGKLGGGLHPYPLALSCDDLLEHVGLGSQKLQVELALEPLLNNLHVQ